MDYIFSSLSFAVLFGLCSHYSEDSGTLMVFEICMWWMIIFCIVYFIRVVLTQFFVTQVEAEKTRDALTQILNNLPNAVLMLESN